MPAKLISLTLIKAGPAPGPPNRASDPLWYIVAQRVTEPPRPDLPPMPAEGYMFNFPYSDDIAGASRPGASLTMNVLPDRFGTNIAVTICTPHAQRPCNWFTTSAKLVERIPTPSS
jgi:hypothetical protein